MKLAVTTDEHRALYWAYPDWNDEWRWAWACRCGRHKANYQKEAEAREAAEKHAGPEATSKRPPFGQTRFYD